MKFQRRTNRSEIRSACTHDCPDACSLLVKTDQGRLHIRGDPDHPITQGFACPRVLRHAKRVADPERIQTPLIRSRAGFRPISWNDALDLAAEKLQTAIEEQGPRSVLYLQGFGSMGIRKELVRYFFLSLGPVTTVRGGVCGEAGEEAQRLDFGDCACHDFTDLVHAKAIVLWGKNPAATSPHLVPFLVQARKRGVPVVLIEVRETETSHFVDRQIAVAPGSDGLLALAVVRLIWERNELEPSGISRCENFEAFLKMLARPDRTVDQLAARAGVSRAVVEELADLYAQRRPVASWLGWGLQRRQNGGSTVRCIDALGLLTGNVGLEGGGVNFTSWRRRGVDFSFFPRPRGRTVAVPTFGRDLGKLSNPPVRFAYIHGSNPVCQYADSRSVAQALSRLDFVVVADAFFTDTAEAATLFLPVAIMWEEDFEDAVGSFQHHHLAKVRKALDAPEGVREDLWIANELRRRLNRPEDPFLADPGRALRQLTSGWFPKGGGESTRNPAQPIIPFAERFPTPSGKMRLLTDWPKEAAPEEDFPLRLLSTKTRSFQHSQLRSEEQRRSIKCFVHPKARGAERFKGGDAALLVSSLGTMEVELVLDSNLSQDICLVYSGGWLKFGRGVNALIAGQPTDLGECTAFYDQRVRLEPKTK